MREQVQEAFEALDRGDSGPFRELFAEDAQWLGVPDDGFTPV